MSTLTRVLSVLLVLMTVITSIMVSQTNDKHAVIIQVQTNATNFDSILAESIARLTNCSLGKATVTVVIQYPDGQVSARFSTADLARLTNNQVTFDQFVRQYVLFS